VLKTTKHIIMLWWYQSNAGVILMVPIWQQNSHHKPEPKSFANIFPWNTSKIYL